MPNNSFFIEKNIVLLGRKYCIILPKILQLSRTETDSRFFDDFGKAALLKGTMPVEQKKELKHCKQQLK
ncbi:hypothetical protein FACS189434_05520 [Bacteroidia bacterium]|nr:hypothetical protein FACS189434_05520 [Bacteroidia bacterium]